MLIVMGCLKYLNELHLYPWHDEYHENENFSHPMVDKSNAAHKHLGIFGLWNLHQVNNDF